MRQRVGDKMKSLYSDTDSLIYKIKDVDVYQIMRENPHEFDTSDYPIDNKFGIISNMENKKKVGIMKDECCPKVMTEFAGLRSKCYSVRVEGEDTIKKSQGVKSNVVKTTISFDDYVECLMEQVKKEREQCNIRSKLHVVHSEKQVKIALSPHDTKRFIIDGDTNTLPWGHYSLAETEASLQHPVVVVEEEEGEILMVEGGGPHKKAPRRPKTSSSSGEPKRNRSKKSEILSYECDTGC